MLTTTTLIITMIASALLGAVLGIRKGEAGMGFFFVVIMGPVGALLVLLLADKPIPSSPRA